jgi:NAD(P)-dependent dehydrogenase (short-subunit alcohol dehydrogenase family)
MSPQYNAQTTASELVAEFASSIKAKTILITGVSPGGLGAVFATAVAKASPGLLILAGRSVARAAETANAIAELYPNVQTRTLHLDLGSLQGVRDAAATVHAWDDVPAIDVLVNNAGIMAVDYGLSPDGVELQFATNHLGHYLLTNLLMNKILAAEAPRVVCLSSDGHRFGHLRFDDYNFDVGDSAVAALLPANFHVRAARLTTSGLPMASPRRPTCSWLFPWPPSWAPKGCLPLASTQES